VLFSGVVAGAIAPPLILACQKTFSSQNFFPKIHKSGFLQVRENWKKSGNLSGQGKVRGKYFFGEVRENEKLVPPDVRFSG